MKRWLMLLVCSAASISTAEAAGQVSVQGASNQQMCINLASANCVNIVCLNSLDRNCIPKCQKLGIERCK